MIHSSPVERQIGIHAEGISAPKRILGLDIVRAVAIMLVIQSHFTTLLRFPSRVQAVWFLLGGIGVELFFVLSGFLVGGILFRGATRHLIAPADIPAFWRRRWYRTLPAYLTCLVTLAAANALMHSSHTDSLWPHLLFLQNVVTNHAGVLFATSWSLSVEEWFYLLLPMVFAAGVLTARIGIRRAAGLTALIFCVLPALVRLIFGLRLDFATVHDGVVFRLDSIGFGVGLAYVDEFCPAVMSKLATVRSALVGVIALAVISKTLLIRYNFGAPVYTSLPEAVWLNCLWFTACSASIVPIIAWFSVLCQTRSSAFDLSSRVVSRYSYSLYLWHWPVLLLFDRLVRRYLLHMNVALELAAITFITGLIAVACYTYIEKPFMLLRDRVRPIATTK